MQAIKGIKFQFSLAEGNLELLLKRYSKTINLFLGKIFIEKANSLSKLNMFRKEIYRKTGLTGHSSVIAMRSALAIYRSWKKNGRKEIPRVKAKFIQLQPGYNYKLVGKRLRITFERIKYIWLELKGGKYQQMFLAMVKKGKSKLGQITVGKRFAVLSLKKSHICIL
jgi:hypothetical protein